MIKNSSPKKENVICLQLQSKILNEMKKRDEFRRNLENRLERYINHNNNN